MNCTAEITIREDILNIQKLFKPEAQQTTKDRSSYTVEKTKDKLIFKINAKDSVALRATLNTITKILTVYEKTRGIIK